VRKSENIETEKSPEEIRTLIVNNTEKTKFWSFTKTTIFFHKVDGNLISLWAGGIQYWPISEIELNEFIKPRLKINFLGFRIFIIFYSFLIIQLLIKVFEIDNWVQTIWFFLQLILYGLILIYVKYIQQNTRNWIIGLLNENK
jgi:hypothetical protein